MNGLVLVGGKSVRLGMDKSRLMWQNVPLYLRGLQLLKPYCDLTYLSCRADQISAFAYQNLLVDRYPDSGPMGAILTALDHQPTASWLVLAVDLPLVNRSILNLLVQKRDADKLGTCFVQREGLIQPLCTIYEPPCRSVLAHAVDIGQLSLQKLIREEPFAVISTMSDHFLNINRPEDWDRLQKK